MEFSHACALAGQILRCIRRSLNCFPNLGPSRFPSSARRYKSDLSCEVEPFMQLLDCATRASKRQSKWQDGEARTHMLSVKDKGQNRPTDHLKNRVSLRLTAPGTPPCPSLLPIFLRWQLKPSHNFLLDLFPQQEVPWTAARFVAGGVPELRLKGLLDFLHNLRHQETQTQLSEMFLALLR